MKFADVPQFTRSASYQVDVDWHYLERRIDHDVKEYKLNLDPDFQRGHVWSTSQQTNYVEFVLKGGHSSKELIFNCVNWQGPGDLGDYVIVDGKQRLTAALLFLRNKLPIFGGHHFRDFTDRLRGHKAGFKWSINDLGTRAEVLRWYLELNTGGVVHTSEEISRVRALLEKESNGQT